MNQLRLGEFHEFAGGGKRFLYLVPSGAIFELGDAAAMVVDHLKSNTAIPVSAEVDEAVQELLAAHAIHNGVPSEEPVQRAPMPFPLQTLVLNLTNQCNLSCKYCYEFGEDRVATPEGKPEFMPVETAKASVDYLIEQSPGRRHIHLTFFGGETLMNVPVLRATVDYARQRAHEAGKYVDFSLTTNATLLTPGIIEYLAENRIGVTVSLDGNREQNDSLRVFANGHGSYDILAPKVKELLARHNTRPIAARVTLTSNNVDVLKIYKHLKQDMGFHEVGFAPVTTSPNRLYAIGSNGLDHVLTQFTALAQEYMEFALRGEHHGFSNVSDTLSELHAGISKAHPCGASLGLMGVGPSGDIAPCHRFVDSDTHKLGHISTGIDRDKQADFLERGHISQKFECHTCWARPVCSGGCYHEAYVRYGDTGHANLHYCDWIRGWTDLCLRIYGEIASHNPKFLAHFDEKESGGMKHLRAVNQKAVKIEEFVASEQDDVFALQGGPQSPQKRPHIPLGCSLVFFPGWEVDSAGGTAGLCQPVERDLYDCYVSCFWPAQVPDHLNNYPDWTSKCASATKDWRNIDLVFP